jgi:methionine synthase II (cobalamin-independent)
MTPALQTEIEQKEAMLARAKLTKKAAEDAIAASKDETEKDLHRGVVNHRTQRIEQLEAEIYKLRGSKPKVVPTA